MKFEQCWTRRHANGARAAITRSGDASAHWITVWPAVEQTSFTLAFSFPELTDAQHTADLLAHAGCIGDACDPWREEHMNRRLLMDLGVMTESEAGPLRPTVELAFLVRPACEKAATMRAHLEAALSAAGWPTTYAVIDQDALDRDDRRTGYATPTVLYRGRDLFGLPAPAPPYPNPT